MNREIEESQSHQVTKSPGHKVTRSQVRCLLLVAWGFGVFVTIGLSYAYALNLDKIKVPFLNGDYKSAIAEGEKIMAVSGHSQGEDELYYLLGLSYLKDGNYLRASDIFEIIIGEFEDSAFKDDAIIGLGDSYFLKGDFDKASEQYKKIANANPSSKLTAAAYYRLSQSAASLGNDQQAKNYLDTVKQKFPLSLEAYLNKELAPTEDFYYTVQVGSFSRKANAAGLTQKLTRQGYPAYLQEATSAEGNPIYRVRVGKLRLKYEARELEQELSREGYPTKIFP